MSEWLTATATFFAAIATFLGWLVQRSVDRAEKRRIILDIYERFFTREECRRVLLEIARQREAKEYHKFWVGLREPSHPGEVNETDLDEYLGYFELLGGLVRRGTVFFEDVNDLFGYYVETAWKHPSIRKYVEDIRRDSGDVTAYEHFQYLAGRVLARTVLDVRRREHRMQCFGYGAAAFAVAAAVAGGAVGWGIGQVMQITFCSPPGFIPWGTMVAGAGLGLIIQIFVLTFLWYKERETGFAMVISSAEPEEAYQQISTNNQQ